MEGVLLAVAAVIVTYNSAGVIGSCLEALLRVSPTIEAIVVDNASTDTTVEVAREFEGVRVIANRENRGFAGGVNQGVKAAQADCVLMLNPDVRVTSPLDALEPACMESGLSTGLLTDESGQAQVGFAIRRLPTPAALCFELLGINRVIPTNRVNQSYRYLDLDVKRPSWVEQPAGAFLMFRKDVWQRLGGFDEAFYPVWFEDVDFCSRALRNGFRIRYVPEVRAMHEGGHSVNRMTTENKTSTWYVSLLTYAAKHFSPTGYRVVCLAAGLSTGPRMVAGMIQERSFTPVTTYLEILRSVGKRLLSSLAPVERLG